MFSGQLAAISTQKTAVAENNRRHPATLDVNG
jgi:hypothetical protein